MFLGRGTYGAVIVKDNCAVKKFHKLSHLIQEYMAMQYLSDSDFTVHCKKVDWANLELYMELYDVSLREFLEGFKHGINTSLKKDILRRILFGLIELHSRGLVHGDLKPGNVLVKKEPWKLVLGDLGFVAPAKYGKCERTAVVYRDPHVRRSTSHDMFSFGVMMIEIIGDINMRKQARYTELKMIAKKEIPDHTMRRLAISLIQANHRSRPTAQEALHILTRESLSIYVPTVPDFSLDFPEKKLRIIEKWMREATKLYKIARAKRGFDTIIHFLAENNVKQEDYQIYVTVMLMILSAVFGASGFSENHVIGACQGKYDLPRVFAVLNEVLTYKDIINVLMYT